jgi:alkylation response protein AidB-like acyl-CoA dehydrogenase
VIDTAFDIGISSLPDRSLSDSAYGVWGPAEEEVGLMPSVVLLGAIAETCGGIAMALHVQGLACNLWLRAGFEPVPGVGRVALALQEGFTLPYLDRLLSPTDRDGEGIVTQAASEPEGYLINGEKSFVYSLPDPQAYLVMAADGQGWGLFRVPAAAEGLQRTDPGQRTGLRACELRHLRLEKVQVEQKAGLGAERGLQMVFRALSLNWIGMCAIAVGVARGALAAARQYCAERYQGGTVIENHPAVKGLIAASEARMATAGWALCALAGRDPETLETVGEAARLKLTVMELCAQAVTDSLQTLGGYGYMEDYGMEKRLRDMAVLRSAAGSSIYLKQLIADIDRKGRA